MFPKQATPPPAQWTPVEVIPIGDLHTHTMHTFKRKNTFKKNISIKKNCASNYTLYRSFQSVLKKKTIQCPKFKQIRDISSTLNHLNSTQKPLIKLFPGGLTMPGPGGERPPCQRPDSLQSPSAEHLLWVVRWRSARCPERLQQQLLKMLEEPHAAAVQRWLHWGTPLLILNFFYKKDEQVSAPPAGRLAERHACLDVLGF